MLAYGIYQHLAISSYGFSRWSGTMPHTEITANLDWKHVAYVWNMYDTSHVGSLKKKWLQSVTLGFNTESVIWQTNLALFVP